MARGWVQVGMVACNDYILLESCMYRVLQKQFSASSYYVRLLELFHEVRVVDLYLANSSS